MYRRRCLFRQESAVVSRSRHVMAKDEQAMRTTDCVHCLFVRVGKQGVGTVGLVCFAGLGRHEQRKFCRWASMRFRLAVKVALFSIEFQLFCASWGGGAVAARGFVCVEQALANSTRFRHPRSRAGRRGALSCGYCEGEGEDDFGEGKVGATLDTSRALSSEE